MELFLCLLTCLIYQTVALVLLPNCELSGCDERPFRCNIQRRGCVEYRINEKPGTFIYLKGITTNETRLIIDNIYGLRVKFISPQQDPDHICDIFNIKDVNVTVIMDGKKSICGK